MPVEQVNSSTIRRINKTSATTNLTLYTTVKTQCVNRKYKCLPVFGGVEQGEPLVALIFIQLKRFDDLLKVSFLDYPLAVVL